MKKVYENVPIYQIKSFYLSAEEWDSAMVQITLKLDLYDMVDLKKQKDSAQDARRNYFEGVLLL